MRNEKRVDTKTAHAMEICEKYHRIKSEGKKAEAAWKYNLDQAAEAKYQSEKEMYEEYAEKALAGFKASIEWVQIVDRAIRMVSSYEAQCVLTQHFVEGKPLKAISRKNGQCMSRTTATKYKKIGIDDFGDNILMACAELDRLERILETSF